MSMATASRDGGPNALDEVESFLPPFLSVVDGQVRVSGHRVGLWLVGEAVYEGRTATEIAGMFDSVPAETLGLVIEYCREREPMVRDYCARKRAEADAILEKLPPGPTLKELRARKAAMQTGG